MDFKFVHMYFTFKSKCKFTQIMDSSAPNSMLMDPYTAGMNPLSWLLALLCIMIVYTCIGCLFIFTHLTFKAKQKHLESPLGMVK